MRHPSSFCRSSPRERDPAQLGRTQNEPGQSPFERIGGPGRAARRHLEEAVAAYRLALEEFSRDRDPLDEEVRAIIDRAYVRATETLTTYRDRLDRLAEKLIAEETVDTEGFESLFEDLPPKPTRQAGIPRVIAPGTEGGTSSGPTAPAPNPSPQPA